MDPYRNVVAVCDLCGGEPKCVDFCPEEALEIVSSDEEANKLFGSALEKMLREIEKMSMLVKKRELSEIFARVEKRAENLERKFEELRRRRIL